MSASKPRTPQVLQRKITILGFRGVGKSSLVKQWTEHRFDPEYEPTIIKVDRRRMDVGGIPFIFEIFDTAGQDGAEERSSSPCDVLFCITIDTTLERTMRGVDGVISQDEYSRIPTNAALAHGYIIVYDVTSRVSFEKVQFINDNVLDDTGTGSVPRLLVANKTDLTDEIDVTREEGEALAARLGCPFMEASAKTAENVEDILVKIMYEVERGTGLLRPPEGESKPKGGCCVL